MTPNSAGYYSGNGSPDHGEGPDFQFQGSGPHEQEKWNGRRSSWENAIQEVGRKFLISFQDGGPLGFSSKTTKESGIPAGGAQGGWRRSGGGTFIFLQGVWFQTLCDDWREGPTGKKPLTSRCCPDMQNQPRSMKVKVDSLFRNSS